MLWATTCGWAGHFHLISPDEQNITLNNYFDYKMLKTVLNIIMKSLYSEILILQTKNKFSRAYTFFLFLVQFQKYVVVENLLVVYNFCVH